ncbi:unnamed protein product [Prunus armeniaca]|uniref:Uncharacterized protein n=1 Tax=Prunus armeniaca TaxID=36596 RepID=A0A6J5XFT4_PRUAR|nr:unnamed protein product [Prunus armeniaca]
MKRDNLILFWRDLPNAEPRVATSELTLLLEMRLAKVRATSTIHVSAGSEFLNHEFSYKCGQELLLSSLSILLKELEVFHLDFLTNEGREPMTLLAKLERSLDYPCRVAEMACGGEALGVEVGFERRQSL